jgi:hypothetical protein
MPSGLVMTRLPVPEIATATNRLRSGDQHTLHQLLLAADVRDVHVMPSGLVMTRLPVPEEATATNKASSGDQHTLCQLLSAADVRVVQVIPSGLVITRLPVPEVATATNKDLSGDQHTLCQLLSAADVRAVQVMPFGLVMTRLPEPVLATATNNDKFGDQHTLCQSLSAADVLLVQVMPSGLVITRLPVPDVETATNNDKFGDQHTANHQLLMGVVRATHPPVAATLSLALTRTSSTRSIIVSAPSPFKALICTFPFTSKSAPGVVVPIPTLPFVELTVMYAGLTNNALRDEGMAIAEVLTADPFTPTNIENSGDQQTFSIAVLDLDVHVKPSGLVIIVFALDTVAINNEISGAQHTHDHWLSEAEARDVHVIPSGLVITRLPVPVLETATNNDISGDQHTFCQSLSAADCLTVQFIPSGLVITLLPVPALPTATNKVNSGDQQSANHCCVLLLGILLPVHVIPSGLVITPWASVQLMATNNESSLDHTTDIHWAVDDDGERAVHVIPSGLVINRVPAPPIATTTNNDLSGDQHTLYHWSSAADVRLVHVIPSALVITLLPVPVFATITNKDSSEDQHISLKLFPLVVWVFHVLTHLTASADEGIHARACALTAGKLVRLTKGFEASTFVPPREFNPMTKIDSCGDQQTLKQLIGVVPCRAHSMPLRLYMTGGVDESDVTATNNDASGDQHTLLQLLVLADARAVQVMPSGLVITRLLVPEVATATNKDLSGDQHTLVQVLSTADERAVQVMPSGLVITRLPVPDVETATNKDRSGDQHTLLQLLSAADVRDVQVMPSGLVMTRLPVPEAATATNKDSSGDQHTLFQLLSTADVLIVQVMPSGLVITRLPVPLEATATNKASSGDQHTSFQELSAADVRAVHVMPSELVATRFPVPKDVHTATNKARSRDQHIAFKTLGYPLLRATHPPVAATLSLALTRTSSTRSIIVSAPSPFKALICTFPTTSNDESGLLVPIPTLPLPNKVIKFPPPARNWMLPFALAGWTFKLILDDPMTNPASALLFTPSNKSEDSVEGYKTISLLLALLNIYPLLNATSKKAEDIFIIYTYISFVFRQKIIRFHKTQFIWIRFTLIQYIIYTINVIVIIYESDFIIRTMFDQFYNFYEFNLRFYPRWKQNYTTLFSILNTNFMDAWFKCSQHIWIIKLIFIYK